MNNATFADQLAYISLSWCLRMCLSINATINVPALRKSPLSRSHDSAFSPPFLLHFGFARQHLNTH